MKNYMDLTGRVAIVTGACSDAYRRDSDLFRQWTDEHRLPERLDRTGRPPPIGADDDSDGGCAAFVLPDLLFPDARNHPIHWEDSGKGKGDISRGF